MTTTGIAFDLASVQGIKFRLLSMTINGRPVEPPPSDLHVHCLPGHEALWTPRTMRAHIRIMRGHHLPRRLRRKSQ
jgi:hypothetical protein